MARKKKYPAVVGIFETRTRADQAMDELRRAGFSEDRIGLVARNSDGRFTRNEDIDETYADEGAVAGMVAGAGAGALVGAGVLAGVIPVVGPILAIGALGTILLNAAGGAAIAGIAGALIGWGIPEEDATYYESEVREGRFLVTVDAGDRADEARAILHRFGGFDRSGWSTVNAYRASYGSGTPVTAPALPPVTASEIPPAPADLPVNLLVEQEEIVIERRPVSRSGKSATPKSEAARIPVSDGRKREKGSRSEGAEDGMKRKG